MSEHMERVADTIVQLRAQQGLGSNMTITPGQGKDFLDQIARLSSENASLRADLDTCNVSHAKLSALHAAANKRADKEYVDHERTLRKRDDYADLLDKFVHAVGGVDVCGEHSNLNDPWTRALDEVKSIVADLARVTGERDALQSLIADQHELLEKQKAEAERVRGAMVEMTLKYQEVHRLLLKLYRDRKAERVTYGHGDFGDGFAYSQDLEREVLAALTPPAQQQEKP